MTLRPRKKRICHSHFESDAEAEAVFDDVFDNVMGVNAEVGIGGTGFLAVRLIH